MVNIAAQHRLLHILLSHFLLCFFCLSFFSFHTSDLLTLTFWLVSYHMWYHPNVKDCCFSFKWISMRAYLACLCWLCCSYCHILIFCCLYTEWNLENNIFIRQSRSVGQIRLLWNWLGDCSFYGILWQLIVNCSVNHFSVYNTVISLWSQFSLISHSLQRPWLMGSN